MLTPYDDVPVQVHDLDLHTYNMTYIYSSKYVIVYVM